MDTAVPVVEHRPTVLLIVPSLQAGGAERQTIALLNGLDERRIRTFLLYLKRGETLRPEVRADRLAAVWCCEAADGFDRNVLRRLVRWIDSHAVDVLVC